MARKLAIANIVKVSVKFSLNDNGTIKPFAFSMTAKRLDQNEIKTGLSDGDELISAFLTPIITGWDGQKLVVEEDGTPADFDSESLAMMLGTAGVSAAIFNAYLKECGAKTKN